MKHPLYESGENYLEGVLILEKKMGSARVTDISKLLGVTKPSVSRALNHLKKDGYVDTLSNGQFILTSIGKEKAGQIYDRHITITGYLTNVLNVSSATAEQDACRIEHVISEETFTKIKRHLLSANFPIKEKREDK